MKNFSISLRQFTVLALLGLAVWLQSPLIACAVVVTLAIKEAREYFEGRQKNLDVAQLEARVNGLTEELRKLHGEMNRVVSRQVQYFGE